MTVYDLLYLAIDDSEDCKVYSSDKDDYVFVGTMKEAMEECGEQAVNSWEIINGDFVINID